MQRSSWRTAVAAGSLIMLAAGCASNPKRPNLASLGNKSSKRTTSSRAAAAELAPKQAAEVCLATAQAMEEGGFETEAIVQYEKARQHNPRLTGVSRRLAVLYDRQGNEAKAVEEYQLALKASPKDASLLNDFGYFQYERGRWSESEKWLRQAIAVDSSHSRAWCNLAMALAQQGRFDESYDAFTKIIAPAQARSNIAMVMAQQGQTELAKESVHLALAADPDLKPALVLQAKLEGSEVEDEKSLVAEHN